jgi:3-hydroxy-9,10-secoandrosta-1,3,5(10)-triene-9,17-dione monooxygenase reductase component
MSGFDATRFRQVLGHFPTGVTVVTGAANGTPAGLTIGSFTSVSLDPPLVGFFPGRTSSSWPVIDASGAFCVNVLSEHQHELCWRFAREIDDKFDGVAWRPGATGSPIIDGVVAWIDCDIDKVVEAGDHWFVMGRVRELGVEGDHGPMLFFRGQLGGFTGT